VSRQDGRAEDGAMHTADIKASWAGVTKTATLTITPNASLLKRGWTTLLAQMEGRHKLSLSVSAPIAPNAAPGSARRYSLYSPELSLLAESETTTATTPQIAFEYVWFGGLPLAQIETATNTLHFYFNDHLGTPFRPTTPSVAIDWRVEREPYGKIFSTRAGTDRHQPLAFPGQEDGISERSYNIFRWYRAGWGRYAQADPILARLASSFHAYGYASQNPSLNFDPFGLLEIRPSCGASTPAIHQAVRQASQQTHSCLMCSTPQSQWRRLRDALLGSTIDCVSNEDLRGNCAGSVPGQIWLNLRNFLPGGPPTGCPCLPALLAHEAAHQAFPVDATGYEGISWRIERNCFTCGQPWPPGTRTSL